MCLTPKSRSLKVENPLVQTDTLGNRLKSRPLPPLEPCFSVKESKGGRINLREARILMETKMC